MIREADVETVTVIGSGIVGLTTAWALSEAGMAVRLLDRMALGREASWAGGGILCPLHPWRYPDAVQALAWRAAVAYPELASGLAERTGIDPEWTRSGLLVLDGDAGAARIWSQRWNQPVEFGSPRELAAWEPALTPTEGSVVRLPQAAQVRNPRLLQALSGALRARGVTIREHCTVHGLRVAAGRVIALDTGEGRVSTDGPVVVAAGAWSADLVAPLGAPVPIAPVKGQMLLFEAAPGLIGHVVLKGDRYALARRDGRVLFGSTVESAGFDKQPDPAIGQQLREAAVALIPALAEAHLAAHWAGLRPGSPDGIPIIGRHPQVANLWLNAGHYRNGVLLAPASAELLADLLQGRRPALDPALIDRAHR
ncbi:MAG TPA: glycine oxidase ThiO, partial [Gammaproteobacteria bacterium]|nr:glycine oxidase ThiO [Gammaproteobacteria bacterium]